MCVLSRVSPYRFLSSDDGIMLNRKCTIEGIEPKNLALILSWKTSIYQFNYKNPVINEEEVVYPPVQQFHLDWLLKVLGCVREKKMQGKASEVSGDHILSAGRQEGGVYDKIADRFHRFCQEPSRQAVFLNHI
jgi:hypothetical protein